METADPVPDVVIFISPIPAGPRLPTGLSLNLRALSQFEIASVASPPSQIHSKPFPTFTLRHF